MMSAKKTDLPSWRVIKLSDSVSFRPRKANGKRVHTELGFYEKGNLRDSPFLPLEDWIVWAVRVVSSDWAKTFVPEQWIPIHLLGEGISNEKISEMREAIDAQRNERKALLPAYRRILSEGCCFQRGDIYFTLDTDDGMWGFVDDGGNPINEMPFEMVLDFACAILRDEVVGEIDERYQVHWLPCRLSEAWISKRFDSTTAEALPWDTECEGSVDVSQLETASPVSDEPEEEELTPAEAPAPDPLSRLRGGLQLLLDLVEETRSLVPSSTKTLLGSLKGMLELSDGQLAEAGIDPAKVGFDVAADVTGDRVEAIRELEQKAAELQEKLQNDLASEIAEAHEIVGKAEAERAQLTADRDTLVFERSALDAYGDKLISERDEFNELSQMESDDLKKRREALDAREAELNKREEHLEKLEKSAKVRLAGKGAELLAAVKKPKK